MAPPKDRYDAKGDFSRIEILDDLIVGKPCRPALLVMLHNTGVIRPGMFENEVDEKAKLIPAGQKGPGFAGIGTHVPACPRITLTWRNLAWEAACVIQPDCPGWPFPHVIKPKRCRWDLLATPSQLPQNSGVIP